MLLSRKSFFYCIIGKDLIISTLIRYNIIYHNLLWNCIHLIVWSLEKQIELFHFDDQTSAYIIFKVLCVFFVCLLYVCIYIRTLIYIQYDILFSLIKYYMFSVINFHELLCIRIKKKQNNFSILHFRALHIKTDTNLQVIRSKWVIFSSWYPEIFSFFWSTFVMN